jgi:hypothetical protein
MKTKSIRIIMSVSVLIFFLQTPANSQTGKVNFSGNWAWNDSKSDKLNDHLINMTVKQDANSINITSTSKSADGKISTGAATFFIDKAEHTTESGNYITHTTASWSDDGKTLTISSSRTLKNPDLNPNFDDPGHSNHWSLIDPKTLLVIYESGMGATYRQVFDKK